HPSLKTHNSYRRNILRLYSCGSSANALAAGWRSRYDSRDHPSVAMAQTARVSANAPLSHAPSSRLTGTLFLLYTPAPLRLKPLIGVFATDPLASAAGTSCELPRTVWNENVAKSCGWRALKAKSTLAPGAYWMKPQSGSSTSPVPLTS